jgi:hypothetical protein
MVVAVMAAVEAAASTEVVEAAVSTEVVEAAASTAALRPTAVAHAPAVGCTAVLAAARTTIPAHPITIPVLHPAGLTARWVDAPVTAIAPAIAQA